MEVSMNRLVLAAALTLVSLTATAEEPNRQWTPTNRSMFDLIQQGYRIVAMSRDTPVDVVGTAESYILQRDKSVVRCDELHQPHPPAGVPGVQFFCDELAKPYAVLRAVPMQK
jgi:hypothetical protein